MSHHRRRLVNALVITCVGLFSVVSSQGQPRIQFEEKVFDFGRIMEGESASHTFRFRNIGNKLLEVPRDKVDVSCGCTAAVLSTEKLKPGEWGEVKVTFDSKGRMGAQSKAVGLVTNDPDQQVVKLEVRGEVYMLVSVSPTSLNFGSVEVGTTRTMTVTVNPWSGTVFNIVGLEVSGDYFRAGEMRGFDSLKRILDSVRHRIVSKFGSAEAKAGLGVRTEADKLADLGADVKNSRNIAVSIIPSAPVGLQTGRLTIRLDLEEKPTIDIPLFAQVVGDIEVNPKSLNFGDVKRGETEQGVFKIASKSKKMFRITGLETSSPYSSYLNAELSEITPGTEYDVKVTVLPSAPVGRIFGTVTATTTNRDQPKIELRFYGSVQD